MNRPVLRIFTFIISLFLLSCDEEEIPSKLSSPDLTNLASLSIETTIKFVNADTVSCLPIHYKVLDKNGQRVYFLENRIELYANGFRQPNNRYISTGKAQIIALEARLASLRSASYVITARGLKCIL